MSTGLAAPVAPVVPIRYRAVGVRRRVAPAGRWVIRDREIWHPPEFVGYDSHGRPVYSEGHWDVVQERVWVPIRRRVIRRGRVVPHAYVRVGGRIR